MGGTTAMKTRLMIIVRNNDDNLIRNPPPPRCCLLPDLMEIAIRERERERERERDLLVLVRKRQRMTSRRGGASFPLSLDKTTTRFLKVKTDVDYILGWSCFFSIGLILIFDGLI